MTESILVAIITGSIALLGNVITSLSTHSKTLYRIEQLEKKQDIHNGVIERVYLLEKSVCVLDEKMNNNAHRIKDIEGDIKNGK